MRRLLSGKPLIVNMFHFSTAIAITLIVMGITDDTIFYNIINKLPGTSFHLFLLECLVNVCLMNNHREHQCQFSGVTKHIVKVIMDTGSDGPSIQDVVRTKL